ncbi:hypothetical protein [Shouchella miscanthi]|uniref:Lipoprotein n=1 Tax=Shouchella miscanthi TaxID=2598861 RepID=A0ABU6NN56_9BACI|nr:hypothetical protein [Shouchella miscanthi]
MKFIKKKVLFFFLIVLAGCSVNDNEEESVADPLMNEIPTVSIYNADNEQMDSNSYAVCWNYCDEDNLAPVNESFEVQENNVQEEIATGETLEISLNYDSPHNISHQLITFDDSASMEKELSGETFEIEGQGDMQYAIITRFLNEDEETVGRLQTNFSVAIN